ncbi:MAG: universal stress protein [Haliangiales bacterium]
MEIKKIVVGMDFSEASEIAVQHAMRIARHAGAEVVLVHVGTVLATGEPVSHITSTTREQWEALLREELSEVRDNLEAVCERLRGQGVTLSHMIRDGFADNGLTDAASELGADLLLVGTHGRTGLKRFFLGSISERVVRLSRTSVMVARPPGASDGGGYKRILVPTDFSLPAAAALQYAFAMAAPDAHIDLVHFWQMPLAATTPYAPFQAAEEALGSVRQAMAHSVEQTGQELLEKHLREGMEVRFKSNEAAPGHGIQELLEETPYELVVMGSHGRRGLSRLLLGSIAEVTTRHANCSVVVVRSDEDRDDA